MAMSLLPICEKVCWWAFLTQPLSTTSICFLQVAVVYLKIINLSEIKIDVVVDLVVVVLEVLGWFTFSSSMETIRLIGVPSSIWSTACNTDFPGRSCSDNRCHKGLTTTLFTWEISNINNVDNFKLDFQIHNNVSQTHDLPDTGCVLQLLSYRGNLGGLSHFTGFIRDTLTRRITLGNRQES